MKISNKIKTLAAGGLGVVAMGLQALPVAATGKIRCPDGTTVSGDLSNCGAIKSDLNNNNLMGTLNQIINVIIGVDWLYCLLSYYPWWCTYTTSAGDSGKLRRLKILFMYGIIGTCDCTSCLLNCELCIIKPF